MVEEKKFNGWKNVETWEVALHLNNEGLVDYFNQESDCFKTIRSYRAFIKSIGLENKATSDGVKYLNNSLDYRALTDMLLAVRRSK